MYSLNRMIESQSLLYIKLSTGHNGVNHIVLKRTWWPFASHMQMSIPTLLLKLEKETLTLHLSLSGYGFLHLILLLLLSTIKLVCCWVPTGVGVHIYVELCCLRFALLQPSKRCFALSTILPLESVTCCQSLRILAFHTLHEIVVIDSAWVVDTWFNE